MTLALLYPDTRVEYRVRANPIVERQYPCYAQILNHVQWTAKMGLPVQNILDYTNVPARFGGIPSVFQLVQTAMQKPVSLTKALQEWMFGLLEENAPTWYTRDQIVQAWANLYNGMKAYTNKTGWDNGYADYIQKLNLESEPMKLQPCISHNATVLVKRAPFRMYNAMTCEIECADAFDPATLSLTWAGNTHLLFAALNWARFPLPYGKGEPFPKLGGNTLPVPLLGNHTTSAYIQEEWLRFLDADEPVPAEMYWEG
jgi:hypothetical protein